jgi:hypothetical protein
MWVQEQLDNLNELASIPAPGSRWPYNTAKRSHKNTNAALEVGSFHAGVPCMECTFYYANNGVVIRVSGYDSNGDRKNVKLHIIPNDSADIKNEIANIISLELITNK